MTDEMFGVITTVNAERFWRCNQPSQVSQTETSKRRSQSICLSVFLPPATLSWQHLWASITHPRQSVMCMANLFLSATKILWIFGFDYQSLQLATVCLPEVAVLLSSDVPPGLWSTSHVNASGGCCFGDFMDKDRDHYAVKSPCFPKCVGNQANRMH